MARKPANAEPDFETTLAQLETIVAKLESGELPLEDTTSRTTYSNFVTKKRNRPIK